MVLLIGWVAGVGSSSSYGHVVWGRRLLVDDKANLTSAPRTDSGTADEGRRLETIWFVQLVVGNRLVFAICITVFIGYLAAVVARILLNAPVRICTLLLLLLLELIGSDIYEQQHC